MPRGAADTIQAELTQICYRQRLRSPVHMMLSADWLFSGEHVPPG